MKNGDIKVDDNRVLSDNLSNNSIDVASGNFSQNKLINFDGVFNGLEKSVGLFFPSVRNAMVERYQAETTMIILNKAIELIQDNGLDIKQIPPKIALPLFDKLSIEHETEMYDLWAKLLVSASDNSNPILIQYSEILSKIGSNEAHLLLDMYNYQSMQTTFRSCGGNFEEYSIGLEHFNSERTTYKNIEIKILQTLNDIRKIIYIPTLIAIKIKHCFKKLTTRAVHDYRGYAIPLYDISQKYNVQENKTSLRVLSELGLVKYYCGHYPVITKFGCEFVEELEKYNTVDKK